MKRPWQKNRCENPACPGKGGKLRKLFHTPAGILLQKRWYSGLDCFGRGLEELFAHLRAALPNSEHKPHRLPLGLLMLAQGLISQDKLKAALQAQRETGNGRVGDWLRNQGAATEGQITRALGVQWSLPVYPLDRQRNYLECAPFVPFPLLEAFRMLPARFMPVKQLLYVAFAGRVDHTALYGIEQMLECQTEACLAQQSEIERALEGLRREARPPEILLEGPLSTLEMIQKTSQYAAEVGAREVRAVSCGDYIWVRLWSAHGLSNLLFHTSQTGRQRPALSVSSVA